MDNKKIFLSGNCRECGEPVSGYSSKKTIKNQGVKRVTNRLCTNCAQIRQRERKGKSVAELKESTSMEACGCRYLSKEEIGILSLIYGTI